jgi:hypothetical protein
MDIILAGNTLRSSLAAFRVLEIAACAVLARPATDSTLAAG